MMTKNVKNMSVDEMLLNTFKIYQEINMRMLKSNELKINEAIKEVKLLEKVKPSLKKYISNKEYAKGPKTQRAAKGFGSTGSK